MPDGQPIPASRPPGPPRSTSPTMAQTGPTRPHPSMAVVDGHLDLGMLAVVGRDLTRPATLPTERSEGPGDADDGRSPAEPPFWTRPSVTIPDLAAGGVGMALATIFTQCDADPAECPYGYLDHDDADGAAAAAERQLAAYRDLESAGATRIVRFREELPELDGGVDGPTQFACDGAPLPIVILMEGADPIRDADDVARWHGAGVRVVGLTWAMGSRHAGGDSTGGGLTASGRAVVRALDDHGIVHDASHLSAAALDELLDLAQGAVVASHSNCRALVSEHDRHLHDRHIVAIAERGGVVGLNLYTRFLRKDRRATLDDALDQLERIAALGGETTPALGSDMDGGFGADSLPIGLDSPRHLPSLIDGLRGRGWSERRCALFARGNWLRVLRRALPMRA